MTQSPSAALSRPRRSMLYMPGSNARALEKARALPADSLILDLEDAVAPDAKAQARAQVAAAIKAGGYGRRELVIRCNSLDTPWGRDDAAMAATAGAAAVLIAKAESAAAMRQWDALLAGHGAPAELALMAMIETPAGVLNAAPIAGATPRMACLVMGTSDLVKDLRARHTAERLPLAPALGHVVLAARAAGIACVDGVHLDLNDTEGLDRVCRQGRDFGFDGKTLIHPGQIAAANAAFAPSAAELAWSEKIIAAHAEAEARGQGVVLVEGKLIENLHVEAARRLVALGQAIRALEAAA